MQVIQTFALIGDREVEQALREFIRRPDEIEQLKMLAMYVLKHIGAETPNLDLTEVNKEWKDVLDKAWRIVEKYESCSYDDVRRIWSDYLAKNLEQSPRIKRLNTWAAGLAYLVLRRQGCRVTQVEIAKQFEVSVSAVSRISRLIDETVQS
jgi:hypothetical protein